MLALRWKLSDFMPCFVYGPIAFKTPHRSSQVFCEYINVIWQHLYQRYQGYFIRWIFIVMSSELCAHNKVHTTLQNGGICMHSADEARRSLPVVAAPCISHWITILHDIWCNVDSKGKHYHQAFYISEVALLAKMCLFYRIRIKQTETWYRKPDEYRTNDWDYTSYRDWNISD